jgi:hypothetical protein
VRGRKKTYSTAVGGVGLSADAGSGSGGGEAVSGVADCRRRRMRSVQEKREKSVEGTGQTKLAGVGSRAEEDTVVNGTASLACER